jgi:hypothetical protein
MKDENPETRFSKSGATNKKAARTSWFAGFLLRPNLAG